VSHLAEVAETIRDAALTNANRKFLIFESGEYSSLLARPDYFDAFKYGLACGLADALAAHDQRVQAVYVQDTASNPDSEIAGTLPVDPSVLLIVLVAVTTAALEGFITALDRALLASLKELNSPHYMEREFILDALIVTEEEAQQGTGYGRMLKSVFAPPLRVWQREA
jgi:hypothetical protein